MSVHKEPWWRTYERLTTIALIAIWAAVLFMVAARFFGHGPMAPVTLPVTFAVVLSILVGAWKALIREKNKLAIVLAIGGIACLLAGIMVDSMLNPL